MKENKWSDMSIIMEKLFCRMLCVIGFLVAASTACPILMAETEKSFAFPDHELQAILDGVTQQGVPGVALGIGNGKSKWFGASGVSDIKTNKPMTADCQFRIASVTKALAALVTWKLIERKELSLSDKVNDFLKPGLVLQGDKITIGMLLNHTSGIYDHENDPDFEQETLNHPTRHWTTREVLAISRKHGMNFEPGTDYSYCNTAYFILGMILENVKKKSPNELFAKIVARPSAISKTSLNRQGSFTSKKYTPGYCYFNDTKGIIDIGRWNFSWDWTAGSAITTAPDMIRISSALIKGKILHPHTMAKMWTMKPPSLTYYGFETAFKQSPFQWVIKSGCNQGTTTMWMLCPEKGWSLFIGLNFSDYRDPQQINNFNILINACHEVIHTMGWQTEPS